jgi:sulfate transport system ATP-binding protein
VTHDQEEALEVADRVAILNAGRIEQIDTPQEVYDNPANPFVFNFLGNVNIFHGRAEEGRTAGQREGTASVPGAAYVRSHDIEISRTQDSGAIAAKILHITAAGPIAKVQLSRLDTQEIILAEITRQCYSQLDLRVGETVFVNPHNPRFFADDYNI